jgi:hypothetical protein
MNWADVHRGARRPPTSCALVSRDAHGVYRSLGCSDVNAATWIERR